MLNANQNDLAEELFLTGSSSRLAKFPVDLDDLNLQSHDHYHQQSNNEINNSISAHSPSFSVAAVPFTRAADFEILPHLLGTEESAGNPPLRNDSPIPLQVMEMQALLGADQAGELAAGRRAWGGRFDNWCKGGRLAVAV